jgi:HEAT repeat protein
VRADAARFVGEIGPVCAGAVPLLREGLKNGELAVRAYCAIAVLELGGDPTPPAPVIREALEAGDDQDLKNAAQSATWRIQHGDHPYVPERLAEPARRPLARALAAGDFEAAMALLHGSFPSRAATATLSDCLDSENEDLRRDAIRALARLGPVARAARPALEAALAAETAEFREELRGIAEGPDARSGKRPTRTERLPPGSWGFSGSATRGRSSRR